ncbi:UNVERIFIED_CONTAM: hypothetical protein FKN15_017649 [Acipenser sinensis]
MLTSLRNRKMSSSAISSELAENSGTLVHPSTVRRSLVRSGLHGRLAAKKPYLRRGNKAKRLNYVRKHRNWGAEKWQQVLWTDESKFEIFGCSRRQFVLAVAEGSLFAEGLESGTRMSVCRQQ